MRRSISSAALLVKVMARISCGAAPASSRRSRRATSSQVLPLPAQASTTTELAGAQAARVALEQRQPDVVFEFLEPFRQGGLRGAERGGCLAHVSGLRQAKQHLQVAQPEPLGPIHQGIPFEVYPYPYG